MRALPPRTPAGRPAASRTARRRQLSRRRRRRLRRTAFLAACLVLAAVTVAVVVSAQGPGPSRRLASSTTRPTPGRSPTPTAAPTTTAPPTTTTTVPPTTTTTDAGALPQTGDVPSASSPQFQSEMNALWQGVVTGSVQPAMPAFFPEDAYVQVKSGGGNQSDWQYRLVAAYSLDIGAAHALLGSNAGSAQLVGVNVPAQFAHWVTAGSCENNVGYFEVPNARLVYQVNGQEQSFGIASMISWRGEWYVVHLGAVERSGSGGQVDDPESGAGTPTDSGTC